MKKSEVFFDAVTLLPEELIDKALDHRFRRRDVRLQRWLSVAACLALVVTASAGALRLGIIGGFGSKSDSANMEIGNKYETAEDSHSRNDAADLEPGDAPAESPAEDASPEAPVDNSATVHTFRGKIAEVGDGYLLVEPDDGSWIRSSCDLIEVPVETTDGFAPDLSVTVTFSGAILETYPAQITDVVSVALSEK